jgi:membrane associated rhomboid family serine protease
MEGREDSPRERDFGTIRASMIFPFATDRPLRHPTVVTHALIAVNVIVHGLLSVLQTSNPEEHAKWLHWAWVQGPITRPDFAWHTLITSVFLHGGIRHLLGNMLVLWTFGPSLEDRFGKFGFLVFYLCGGAASSAAHAWLERSPAIGASGAIAAVTGAFLVLFPFVMVRCFSLLGMGLVEIKAWWFVAFAIIWDLFSQGTGMTRGIAHVAHLGGYGFGCSVAFLLLATKILPRQDYDLLAFAKQRRRRTQLQTAVRDAQRVNAKRFAQAKSNSAESDRLAMMRAEVIKALGGPEIGPAARAYRVLADTYGHVPNATTLQRRHQYDLASRAYQAGDSEIAAYAFGKFLEGYPTDAEAPQIKLLLGMIHARSLNDPVKAKALINEAMAGLDEAGKVIARRELAALG